MFPILEKIKGDLVISFHTSLTKYLPYKNVSMTDVQHFAGRFYGLESSKKKQTIITIQVSRDLYPNIKYINFLQFVHYNYPAINDAGFGFTKHHAVSLCRTSSSLIYKLHDLTVMNVQYCNIHLICNATCMCRQTVKFPFLCNSYRTDLCAQFANCSSRLTIKVIHHLIETAGDFLPEGNIIRVKLVRGI